MYPHIKIITQKKNMYILICFGSYINTKYFHKQMNTLGIQLKTE